MLAIVLFIGLFVAVVVYTLMDLTAGPDKPKWKLKKHLMSLNGIEPVRKNFMRSFAAFGKYSRFIRFFIFPFAVAGVFFVSVVIMDNIYVFIFLLINLVMIIRTERNRTKKKRQEALGLSMRDFMISITNSLKAGNSLQTAIEKSIDDLKRIPSGRYGNPMLEEAEKIVHDIRIGRSMDEALIAFRDRVRTEDADIFVNMTLKIVEKGGDISEILSMVSGMIGEKIIFKRETMTITAAKRYEAKILTIVPVVMVIFLALSAPSYMKPLFDTMFGKTISFIGFFLLTVNYYVGQKIVDIEI